MRTFASATRTAAIVLASFFTISDTNRVDSFRLKSMTKRKRAAMTTKTSVAPFAAEWPLSSSSRSLSTTGRQVSSSSRVFRETTAADATSLIDGVRVHSPHACADDDIVIMPWMGYGTYRLGKDQAKQATLQALEAGYRAIDTAFIYGGETTESLVGQAIQTAIQTGIIQSRNELFITTKHWRKYHGYEPTLQCLQMSLQRLQVDAVDLWLMHWPGPAWTTMNRRNDVVSQDAWHYATTDPAHMQHLRSETWRAMEEALRQGLVRAIGVSNMTISHLKALKKTARMWPPAVNQVELHPLFPQTELLEFCAKEGIIVQAYSSLGGQDTGQAKWKELLGKGGVGDHDDDDTGAAEIITTKALAKSKKKKIPKAMLDLMHALSVLELAKKLQAMPSQVLLRWALDQNCPVIPKSSSKDRMIENAGAVAVRPLSQDEITNLRDQLLELVKANNPTESNRNIETLTRLAWRRDPLRHLDFD